MVAPTTLTRYIMLQFQFLMKRFLFTLIFLLPSLLFAQDPLRFKDEVAELTAHDDAVDTKDLILFTGSSSVRMWKDVGERFPDHNVLNRGFGGSEMSDLVYYFNKLILPYRPKQIFIYEGDNDIAAGRSTSTIIANADKLLTLIHEKLSPTVQVVFISPKPSLARWKLKDNYEACNAALKLWAETQSNVEFIDVWTPALDERGEVFDDIFIEDGLHMNSKGYDIWTKVITPYLK